MIKTMNDVAGRKRDTVFLRNIVFGIEDGLVSTVGFVSGVAAGGLDSGSIILTGLILVFVEAFSMGAGSFLSENSAEEYESGRELGNRRAMAGSLAMFISYMLAGLAVIAPYFFITGYVAIGFSITIAIAALVLLGVSSARVSHVSVSKRVAKMVILGGAAIIIGVLVSRFVGYNP